MAMVKHMAFIVIENSKNRLDRHQRNFYVNVRLKDIF